MSANFSLTILGSSSALPTSLRFTTAHLLNVNERFYLVDCGEGTQIQLRKFKLRFGKIDRIFISHLHGDHVFGLFGLWSSYQLMGRQKSIHLYGPQALKEILDFYLKYFAQHQEYKIHFHAVSTRKFQKIAEDRGLEIYSFPLKHRAPACGFLFREKPAELNIKKEIIRKYNPGVRQIVQIKKGGDLMLEDGRLIPNKELTLEPWKPRSYAYCSDTAYYPVISEYVKDVDLLYHEATFAPEDEELASDTMHSTSEQAALIARKSNARKLLIGHFSTRYKDLSTLIEGASKTFPETYPVNDGDEFQVERYRE